VRTFQCLTGVIAAALLFGAAPAAAWPGNQTRAADELRRQIERGNPVVTTVVVEMLVCNDPTDCSWEVIGQWPVRDLATRDGFYGRGLRRRAVPSTPMPDRRPGRRRGRQADR